MGWDLYAKEQGHPYNCKPCKWEQSKRGCKQDTCKHCHHPDHKRDDRRRKDAVKKQKQHITLLVSETVESKLIESEARFIETREFHIVELYKSLMPDFSDGEYRTIIPDIREKMVQAFHDDCKTLANTELVMEAQVRLRTRLDTEWQRVVDHNFMIGEQDRDISQESQTEYSHTDERVVRWSRGCLGIGKIRPVVESTNIFVRSKRTRRLKKNGEEVFTDWVRIPNDTTFSGCNSFAKEGGLSGCGWGSNSCASLPSRCPSGIEGCDSGFVSCVSSNSIGQVVHAGGKSHQNSKKKSCL